MTPILEVDGATVTFGGLRALDGVTLDVQAGSVVGLIGPNGAGKTTLLNALSGLQPLDSGSVIFDGTDITREPPEARPRRGIGRSFQNLGLPKDMRVTETVVSAQLATTSYALLDPLVRPWRWLRGERQLAASASRTIEELGLTPYSDALTTELSFGVARFVEMAAVLVSDPTLLLLDEPTTGLDVAETERLRGLVDHLRRREKSILLVTHDVSFGMNACDYIYVLATGRLLAAGAPHEIQAHPEVIDAYLGSAPKS